MCNAIAYNTAANLHQAVANLKLQEWGCYCINHRSEHRYMRNFHCTCPTLQRQSAKLLMPINISTNIKSAMNKFLALNKGEFIPLLQSRRFEGRPLLENEIGRVLRPSYPKLPCIKDSDMLLHTDRILRVNLVMLKFRAIDQLAKYLESQK